MKRLSVYVQNLDCENEAAAIERGVRDEKGVLDVKVYAKAGKIEVGFDPSVTDGGSITDLLARLGFPPKKPTDDRSSPPWRNPKVRASVASGVLLLAGWLLSLAGLPAAVPFATYAVSALVGGYFFGREAVEKLVLHRRVGIELLMSAAAVVAMVLGHPSEGAMLAFLYSISEAAEGYTEAKTRSAVRALMKLTPKTALVRRGGREREVPVESLLVDDTFLVRPGQAIPTDGVVIDGTSSVDQSPVTGESMPVDKTAGDTVFAGTINGEGALEARATKTYADNTIARIIHMVEEAQEKKGTSQRFVERFGDRYSPAVLLAGALIAVVVPLATGAAWSTWIARATVFVVAAAPCALVISIPITLVATLGTGARHGVLIKGGLFIERLAKVTVVALDKTGTLTKGRPAVTDVVVSPGEEATDEHAATRLVGLAAGLERYSGHPVAKAVIAEAEARGAASIEVTDFRSITGAGVAGTAGGSTVYVGSPLFFERERRMDVGAWSEAIQTMQDAGKTVMLVGSSERILGAIAVRDVVRPNARRALESLRAEGIERVVMLTGDNERAAGAIGREVGVDEVHANLAPGDKADHVRRLAEAGGTAMVGDGVNDAPALAAATVGIAMGAAGTDVALETADVALMADDLEKLAYAFRLARRNQRIVRQNLVLSAVVIATLSTGALLGLLSLPATVLVHEVSEFVVIASGLRMLRS